MSKRKQIVKFNKKYIKLIFYFDILFILVIKQDDMLSSGETQKQNVAFFVL